MCARELERGKKNRKTNLLPALLEFVVFFAVVKVSLENRKKLEAVESINLIIHRNDPHPTPNKKLIIVLKENTRIGE